MDILMSILKKRNFRNEMRRLIWKIREFSEEKDGDFYIIVNNGEQLLTDNGLSTGNPDSDYLDIIDGFSVESLVYGYPECDQPTPVDTRNFIIPFLTLARDNQLTVLIIDYCCQKEDVDESYKINCDSGFISFAAETRLLNTIPKYPKRPFNVNSTDIQSLNEAKNFLYLINPSQFTEKGEFLKALSTTDYDLLFVDPFFGTGTLDSVEVNSLKRKENGRKRLVFAYMSIGEASDFRYYWKRNWSKNPPYWIEQENPNWPGSFKVRYWERKWHNIVYRKRNSYLSLIRNADFDGVYLDLVDAFEFFEQKD